MGRVKLGYVIAGGDGVLAGMNLQESPNSAKPALPFPFLEEDSLTIDTD